MEPEANKDADEVRRKLLGLVLCPRCGEEKLEKEMDILVPAITAYKVCDQCRTDIIQSFSNPMARGKSDIESILKPKS